MAVWYYSIDSEDTLQFKTVSKAALEQIKKKYLTKIKNQELSELIT